MDFRTVVRTLMLRWKLGVRQPGTHGAVGRRTDTDTEVFAKRARSCSSQSLPYR
jgi:hypothetical protein